MNGNTTQIILDNRKFYMFLWRELFSTGKALLESETWDVYDQKIVLILQNNEW